MAKFVSKNSNFYLRDNDIMINTPSLIAIGNDNSIYINVDLKGIDTKEVRHDFKGTIPLQKNIDFDVLDIESCYFSFDHNVSTKEINVFIKDSKVIILSFKGKDKFDYNFTQDLINFHIENSIIVFQIFLISKKITINTKEIKRELENVLTKDLVEKMIGHIFYLSEEIEINTHNQKIDYILQYINFLQANKEFTKSMIEEYSEKIVKSKEEVNRLEKSIKELNYIMQ